MANGQQNIKCGVYRITNPLGHIYVGCTINLGLRWLHYKNKRCKQQRGVYESIIIHGWGNHKWEVLKEFNNGEPKYTRLFWEAWYWMKFKAEGCILLNIIRPGSSPSLGLKKTPEQIAKQVGEKNHAYGKKFKRTEEQILAKSGVNNPMYGKSGALCPSAKKVIDTITGHIYDTVLMAAESIGAKTNTLAMKLTGYRKNNTSLKYLDYARN